MRITESMIPNIRPIYMVSSYGRVWNTARNRMLYLMLDADGYHRVQLQTREFNQDGNSNPAQIVISRLVKIVFDPIPNYNLYEVHHKDTNRLNNFIGNLQWITPEDHQKITKETWPRGKDSKLYGPNGTATKLTGDQVIEIKNSIIEGNYISLADIARKYGVNETCIWAIVHNVNWVDYGPTITPDMINISTGFTNNEIHAICQYFESHDINNKSIYPRMQDLISECYFSLGLNDKYGPDVEVKRKIIARILVKDNNKLNQICNLYSYHFNYKPTNQPKRKLS